MHGDWYPIGQNRNLLVSLRVFLLLFFIWPETNVTCEDAQQKKITLINENLYNAFIHLYDLPDHDGYFKLSKNYIL